MGLAYILRCLRGKNKNFGEIDRPDTFPSYLHGTSIHRNRSEAAEAYIGSAQV